MIKIERTETYGWEAAIRGMRNPLESWEKSDSDVCTQKDCVYCKFFLNDGMCQKTEIGGTVIGDADFALMKKLTAAGTDHAKYLRMITVTTDIVAPLYWWKEMDTYKVGTVANSCSTMHKIYEKEFTLDDFSHEHLVDDVNTAGYEIVDQYRERRNLYVTPLSLLSLTIGCLNNYREEFLKTQDKKWWWQMIQLLPSSYNQRRTVMLNYAVLRNIYHARKSHKLDEWRGFCEWIEDLPYGELITG